MGLHFRRRPKLGFGIVVSVLLSVGLMLADHRYDALARVHLFASHYVLEPVQFAIDWPFRATRWARMGMQSEHQLLLENARLRAHELLLQAKVHERSSLVSENQELRDLLQSSNRLDATVKAAQILFVSLDPGLNQLVVDMGKQEGVFVGQPVLDAYGVLGQVVTVGYRVSRVLLLTDHQSGVPVESVRTNFRTLAKGSGVANKLQLMYVPPTADVKVGDLFVTSGLALRYPKGYPVARVVSVNRKPGAPYMTISMQPLAKLYQAQQVLMVWSLHADLAHDVSEVIKQPVGEVSHA